ncbi:LpqB family beta-propeller domain-containing protein [Nocardioides daejeonensis]|uniref:LpqB family beta-propeller domain-containing protein n=1 Tax=Nocardioides daejeonensis TaxID=1046556 RepID=UPI000D74740D|nr:LpqB family beta-propeller domain-containing protein [Nocardioides daejeonensis]
MTRRSVALRSLLVAALCLITGCMSLPVDGDVEVHAELSRPVPGEAFPYQPRPPQPGETPTDIVRHFLDAMTATPVTTSVARQFLTSRARGAWRPDEGMITYADVLTPIGASRVSVTLVGAHQVDGRGRWAGALSDDASQLSFEMATEDGEWRIDRLPNAMIVPDNWFEDRYAQRSLFFFDPTGRVLVPEPVFVPRGGQTATSLVRGLLRGPSPGLGGVEQSFVPPGLSLDVLVPEPADGFAEVALTGEVAALDPATTDLLVAQFAWTLRQVPELTRFRLTLNGTPLGASGVGSDIPVSRGEPYDPAVPEGWRDAFALREGGLVSVSEAGATPVGEELPVNTDDWRSIAVDLTATRVAGVRDDGRDVALMPLNGSLDPESVLTGTDLLRPAWDQTDTLWLVDRTAQGAVVRAGRGRRLHEVRIEGVSGRRVRDFVVSRDGSRFVAIVATRAGDRVVASRLARTDNRIRAVAPSVVWAEADEELDLRGLAWRTPTELLVVRKLGARLSQVVRRSVDGSEAIGRGDVSTELVRDQIVDLVSSPVSSLPAWAVGRDGTFHLVASASPGYLPPEEVRALTYPG